MSKPSGFDLTKFQFRISEDQKDLLEEIARGSGLSQSEIVRLGIDAILQDLDDLPDEILSSRSRLATEYEVSSDKYILS